jgi:hypothetical protein
MNIQKQMQKIKGNKLLRQMSKSARREYARLREAILQSGKKKSGASKPKGKPVLWQVSKDSHGTVVFKNKGATLYGISPKEFAQLEKKTRVSKKVAVKKRARA